MDVALALPHFPRVAESLDLIPNIGWPTSASRQDLEFAYPGNIGALQSWEEYAYHIASASQRFPHVKWGLAGQLRHFWTTPEDVYRQHRQWVIACCNMS